MFDYQFYKNTMNKTNIITAASILALLLGVANYVEPSQVVKTETLVREVPSEEFGAIPGTTIPGSKFSVGGIQQTHVRQGFLTATNTVCSIKSPGATSSLLFAQARFNVSSTSATKIQFSNSTNLATTSNAVSTGLFSIGANASVLVQASTTPSAATLFSPNSYLLLGMYGATAGTVSPTGYCEAVFVE